MMPSSILVDKRIAVRAMSLSCLGVTSFYKHSIYLSI